MDTFAVTEHTSAEILNRNPLGGSQSVRSKGFVRAAAADAKTDRQSHVVITHAQ